MGVARAIPIGLSKKMSTYTRDSVVTVEPFTRQVDGNEVIIGRVETGVFLALPAEAVDLLEHLAKGKSVGETSDLYQQRYGEIPDLDDFLQFLESKGIVSSGHGSQAGAAAARRPKQQPRVRYHFANFPHGLAKRLFSIPVISGSVALILLAAMLVIFNPVLTPRRADIYFSEQRTLSFFILLVLSYATLYVHELAHLVAARAVGINSRIGISHRLWFIVAETDLTGLWSLPKRQRILPMFAGVLIDGTSASLLVIALFANLQGYLPLAPLGLRLVRAMVFMYLMRFVWQFMLHIRTDFYFVIANLFNCKNLLKDTEAFLRNQMARVIPVIRRINQSGIPASERNVIRAYSIIWVVGRALSLGVLIFITIPVAGEYCVNLFHAIRIGYSQNPGDFVDAILFSSAFLVPLAAGFALWINSLVRGRLERITT